MFVAWIFGFIAKKTYMTIEEFNAEIETNKIIE